LRFLLPEAFTPRYFTRLILGAMQRMAAVTGFVLPLRRRPQWQELQNKLRTLDLFLHAKCRSKLSSNSAASLQDAIEKVQPLEPYARIWTIEGLGYCYTLAHNETRQRLLSGPDTGKLRASSLIPLHAGMGLAFARRFLAACLQDPSATLSPGLKNVCELYNLHGREGYRGVAHGSLGFAAQILCPWLIHEIDRSLSAMDEKLLQYFWHGVGRAMYFDPRNLAPRSNSLARVLEAVERESLHATARLNALAGLAFAATLVNIRHPEILDEFAQRHALRPAESRAFAGGASAAAITWLDATADELYSNTLSQHRPSGLDGQSAEAWNHSVRGPFRSTREYYVELKKSMRLEEVFRYPMPSGVRIASPFAAQSFA